MKRPRTKLKRRRGTVLVITAVLLPVLLGLVALSVDMGYIVVVQGQLQNTADSAALAGVSVLQQAQVLNNATAGNPTSQAASQNAAIAAARAKVRQFSALNTAGGASVTIPANRDIDIVVGYQSAPGGSITPTSPPDVNFPNAVQVTVRRDSNANTPLSLFFAPAIGAAPWSGQATATAAVQVGNITSFKSIPGVNGKMLPIAINVADWNNFLLTGLSSDGLVHDDYSVSAPTSANSPPNNVTSNPDSIPEFADSGFPGKTGSPGAFGWVDVGLASGGVPTLDNYINNGAAPSDISWMLSNGHLPFPSTMGWSGEPGNKTSAVSTLTNIIGQPREILLYDTMTGSGSNATYHMVGVAGVTVVQAGNGVTLQPSVVFDPTAVSGSGTSGVPSRFVLSPVKLTQ
jgi:Flp pilus assembly protein TadG